MSRPTTANGRFSPQSLARALSSVLLQKGLDQWGDATVDQFRVTLREAKARIEHISRHDALTGLANRHQLHRYLAQRFAERNLGTLTIDPHFHG